MLKIILRILLAAIPAFFCLLFSLSQNKEIDLYPLLLSESKKADSIYNAATAVGNSKFYNEEKEAQLNKDALKLYLDIEKVRFGHRLTVEFQTPEVSLGSMLPALLLQPIVENAIKFGLYDTIGETKIVISAIQQPDHLVIEVRNPFDETTANARSGTGFGLNSIQRRLYLLYARIHSSLRI